MKETTLEESFLFLDIIWLRDYLGDQIESMIGSTGRG